MSLSPEMTEIAKCIGISAGVSLVGALAMNGIRRSLSMDQDETSTAAIGSFVSFVATLFTFVLGFTIVNLWAFFSDADRLVQHEATRLRTMYRLAHDMPDGWKLRSSLREYTKSVAYKEWGKMTEGSMDTVTDEQKPKVRFLEGQGGTKRVFDDVVRSLKKGDTFYRYSSNVDGQEKKDKYLPRSYRSMRDAKQLQREVITNSQTMKLKAPRLERDLKVMPDDFGSFEHNVTELIYGNKVAFIDYNSETAMIIDSKKIAEFQKHIFKMLFKKL